MWTPHSLHYIIYAQIQITKLNRSIDGRVVASTKSPTVSVVYRSTCPPPKVLGTSLIRRSIDPINSNREHVHTPQQQPRELNQSSSRNLAHIYICTHTNNQTESIDRRTGGGKHKVPYCQCGVPKHMPAPKSPGYFSHPSIDRSYKLS